MSGANMPAVPSRPISRKLLMYSCVRPPIDAIVSPAPIIVPPNITTARTPIHSATQPIAMPPQPAPMKVSPTASAGAERVAPNSAAIGFSATMVVSGAPYETLSTISATMATTHDVRVSKLRARAPLPSMSCVSSAASVSLVEHRRDGSRVHLLDPRRLPARLAVLVHHHGADPLSKIRMPHRGSRQRQFSRLALRQRQ